MPIETLSPATNAVTEDVLALMVDDAFELIAKGQWSDARKILRKIIEIAPGLAQLHEALGNVCHHLGRLPESHTAYARAIELAPDNIDFLLRATGLWLEAGQPEHAEPLVHRAAAAGAEHATIVELLARCRIAAASAGSARNLSPEVGERARGKIGSFYNDGGEFFSEALPPPLRQEHLRHSRLLPSREDILDFMPKGGVCAEIGTQTGLFAKKILKVMQPARFHIYDIDFTPFDFSHFVPALETGSVELHVGNSPALLAAMPDRFFDFIYVDGDHAYEGVAADLAQAALKIKDDGWIVCNDYTPYSPLENMKYGVCRAVNELCINHGFEIIYLGLQGWGYHDVALRRIGVTRANDIGR